MFSVMCVFCYNMAHCDVVVDIGPGCQKSIWQNSRDDVIIMERCSIDHIVTGVRVGHNTAGSYSVELFLSDDFGASNSTGESGAVMLYVQRIIYSKKL